jgi:hypothetical protein
MSRWIGTFAALACAAQLQAQTGTPQASASPTYLNAEVVRADAGARTLRFRAQGGESVLTVDGAAAATLSDLKAGDKVIVTYRDAARAADRRITDIRPMSASSAAPAPIGAPVAAAVAAAPVAPAFDASAAGLAVTASQVDREWATYRRLCITKTEPVNARGREWFGILDGSLSQPTDDDCGKRYEQVATAANDFKAQLDKLRATAQAAGILPGALRETLIRHNLDL